MNVLPNGTVLPHGLLSLQGHEASVAAFNQSYRNTGLKAGFVIASYAYNDPNNKSKLCTEYDVQVIEQFENKGSTSILYKNCLSSQGFGSIADYLEYNLRYKTYQTSKGFPTFNDQDGAIVLIRCLDDCGDKAIVTGNLIHPDRQTTIDSSAPKLSGEYNGVNIEIANDGSCSLSFNGATDSKGVPKDASQGVTEFKIEKDGSFQFDHSTITIRADRSGNLTITAKADCNVNCVNANVVATGNTNLTTTDVNVTASGDTSITTSGNTSVQTSGNTDLTTTGKTSIKSQLIELNGTLSGITTANSHLEVIDLITGVPVTPSLTTFGDV